LRSEDLALNPWARIPGVLLSAAAVLLLGILVLTPLVLGFLVSIKMRTDALSVPPKLVFDPTLDNYRAVLADPGLRDTLWNSVVIASGSTTLALFLGIPAAYAFSRFRFSGARPLLTALVAIRMAPATIIALPLFIAFSELRLIDSFVSIISVHTAIALPILVWVLKGFFDELPREVDEASYVDGAGYFRTLLVHVVPACAPGVAISAVFCFITSWNEFYLALILTGYETRPFTVAIEEQRIDIEGSGAHTMSHAETPDEE